MIRKYVLPLLALIGLLFGVYTVLASNKPVNPAQPVADPAASPFKAYVAGAGLVEASTQNIAVGTPTSGVVTDIPVLVGGRVHSHDVLFKLDDRSSRAELIVRQAALASAKAKLERLEGLPRPEDVPAAEARVHEADATLADLRNQLALAESLGDKRAISMEEMGRRRFAVDAGVARVAEAKAQLQLLEAGAWKPDVEIAKADVASAEALVRATEIELDRLVVRAPVDGEVLQVNVRLGEYAQAGPLDKPLMVMGGVDRLHVRIDVDENDAWRFRPKAAAVAYVRGNRELRTELQFERVEPYVVPKRSLTGDSTERVDTRVLQVIYSFDPNSIPIYVGQQMDVFIDAEVSRS
ncbi:MAG: HlyD family efflux transporter periplasmic adaptor subunit [Planctomycetes bacterium]|nr:HlyD family efflux transporter periplasmic adaptor subunit [Planctomycetota bacterium]MBI3848627.1 HlyD family efflux transporter periplasmic adaptor subunit [Planctomycetota bacterium]